MTNSPILNDVAWRRFARLWAGTGVVSPGNVSVAAFAPAMLVSADASGFNVKVSPGEAVVDGGYFADDATITLPIGGPNATNPRIDLVVLRWDGPNNLADYIVLQGTPAAVPVVPAPTQVQGGRWELPLAEVRVNVGVTNIAASAVTDRRAFAAPRAPYTPSFALSYTPTSDPANAFSTTAGQWHQLMVAQNFVVTRTTSIALIEVSALVLVTSAALISMAARVLIDNALEVLLPGGVCNAGLYDAIPIVGLIETTNLAPGTHTIRLDFRTSGAATANCRAVTNAPYEHLRMRVLEIVP